VTASASVENIEPRNNIAYLPFSQNIDNTSTILEESKIPSALSSLFSQISYKKLFFDAIKYRLDYNYVKYPEGSDTVKVVNTMDNNEILEKYIEKVDRDQSDLRSDIRESERRTSERMAMVEERMDNRLNRIEDLIGQTNRDVSEKYDKLYDKMLEIEPKTTTILRWNIGVSIATIIGIAAMVITVLAALK